MDDDKRHDETDDDFWAAAILEWSPGTSDDNTRNLRARKFSDDSSCAA